MHVTHVLKATGLSGAEAHLLSLSAALLKEGFECDLIVLTDPQHPPDALFQAARAKQIPFEKIAIKHDLDVTVIPKIASQLKRAGAQIVHTHMIHGDLYGALAAQAAGLTLIQSRHNHDKFRQRLAVRWLMRLVSAPAKTIITISDSLTEFTRDMEGVPGSKIVRIHYGLDPAAVTGAANPGAVRAELGLNSNAQLVAALGRLTEQKGFAYLLEAFSRVRESVRESQLVIAGDGPLRPALEAQAARLGDTAHILGWRNDAYSILADCNVLAVPSLWEGFGLVTLEAMALSKPVVASRVGALPEIVIESETGFLVPPADSVKLADALVALLTDPERARAMGEQGRARLEKEFTAQRMARQHAAVYKEAASRVPEFRA